MPYISTADIKKHLNLDAAFTGDDTYLGLLESAAESALEIRIGRKLSDIEDDSHKLPPALVHAMLLIIGEWYLYRESVASSSLKELPHAVEYLAEMFTSYKVYG